MTELEIDMNMRIGEWSIIQESGKQLVPCYGPGNTGMANLGNSCYLNSIMQVVFTLPEFQRRLVEQLPIVSLKQSMRYSSRGNRNFINNLKFMKVCFKRLKS